MPDKFHRARHSAEACRRATCASSAIVTLSRKRRCTRVLMVRRNHVAVAVNRTAGTAVIYANGVDVTSDGLIRTDFATSANTDFGQFTGGTSRLNGRLDQVRIYNRVLTAAELLQLAKE